MGVSSRLVVCAVMVVGIAAPSLLLSQQAPKQEMKQVPSELGASIASPRDAKAYLERTLREVEAGTTVLLPFEFRTADGRCLSIEEYLSVPKDHRPKILEPLRVPVNAKDLDLRLRASEISAEERKRAMAEFVANSKLAKKKLEEQLAAINKLVGHYSHEPPLGDGMRLWAPRYYLRKGERKSVKVYLLNAKDVRNLDFAIDYDPSLVSVQGQPARGAVVTELAESNLERPGHLKFNFARLTQFTFRGQAEVAAFTFEGLKRGSTPLTLSLSEGTKLAIQPIHGSIEVYEGPRPPGIHWPPPNTHPPDWEPTCSGAARQHIDDAQCCLKMWVGIQRHDRRMDQDGDGVVDSNDALIIMARLASRGEYR